MKAPAEQSPESQRQAAVHEASQQQDRSDAEFQFVDNRTETANLRQLQEIADNSPQAQGLAQLNAIMNSSPRSGAMQSLQAMVDNSPRRATQLRQHNRVQGAPMGLQAGSDDVLVQRVEEDEVLQGEFSADSPAQLMQQPEAKPNNTGLPDNLKAGVESLSGLSLDNVKVHYNSSEPAQLNAHAYAQGTDIHVGPGQEQHLPHEAWHVVQQAQGRVKPTMQMKDGVSVNDDVGLETEADLMGGKAVAGVVQARRELGGSVESDPIGFPVQNKGWAENVIGNSEQKGTQISQKLDLNSAQPVQRFQDNIVLAQQLSQQALPAGAMYGFINARINALLTRVLQYDNYENAHLDMVKYWRPGQSAPIYEAAADILVDVYNQAFDLLNMIGDGVYDAIRPIVTEIRNCAHQDANDHAQSGVQARTAISDAYSRIFRVNDYYNPYTQYPQDIINAANFIIAKDTGILTMQMIKWWRSFGFPGFNAEIGIFVGGQFWAIAHVKWNSGVCPNDKNDDPYMYNFKTPMGEPFAGEFSLITNDSVQTYLLGTCFHYVGSTAAAWQYGEVERYV